MTRILTLAAILALTIAGAARADTFSDAQDEQTAREEALQEQLVGWPIDGSVDTAVVREVEAITAASLAWLDSLDPDDCMRPWWAAIRTSWELTAVGVRLQRLGYPNGTVMNVFRGIGMTREVGRELAEAATCG